MEKALGRADGCLHTKLQEACKLHPCQSRDGLISLLHMFSGCRVVIVRTIRHPMEIVESFMHARANVDATGRYKGLAANSDSQIIDYIRNESRNTHAQRAIMDMDPAHGADLVWIDVKYEAIELAGWIEKLAKAGIGVHRVRKFIEDKNMKESVRAGRLGDGKAHQSYLSPEEHQWWRGKLRDVLAKECYV